jgi:peptidoglycan/xylan/chitin deacetylase (PgdA/CDA1 family)
VRPLVAAAAVPLAVVCCTRDRPGVPILGYHSVGAVADEYTVSLAAFERQLDWLEAGGFQTISVHDLLSGGERTGRSVILTFDDGTQDAVRVVLPALQKRGMRASFFIVTDFAGRPGYLTWDEVRKLAAAGMEIGSHSLDHSRLADLSDDRVRKELVESKRILELELRRPVEVIAYPYNSTRSRIAQEAKEAGYRAALAGMVHGNADRFSLYRFTVTGTTSMSDFEAAVSGRR